MRCFPVHVVPATLIFTLLAAGLAALPATAAMADDPPATDPASTTPAPPPTTEKDAPTTEDDPNPTPQRVYLWWTDTKNSADSSSRRIMTS